MVQVKMSDYSVFPDLLPKNSKPVRVEAEKKVNGKKKMKFIHMKKGKVVKVKSTTKAAERMRNHRSKPGVRDKERERDKDRKRIRRKEESVRCNRRL